MLTNQRRYATIAMLDECASGESGHRMHF